MLSENAVVRVGYYGADKFMQARLIGEWARGEITMVLSASSGPKDYMKNLIAMALETKVNIGAREPVPVEKIAILCGEFRTSVPFSLFQVQGRWFDCSGKQVVFKRADTADGKPE